MNKIFEKVLKESNTQKINEKSVLPGGQPLKEMAVVGRKQATPKWKGMSLEIYTSEFKGTGEEPHIHLFPANRENLITRIALTKEKPQKPTDLHPIKDNSPIPKDYFDPIFEWVQGTSKRGTNNWENALNIWDAIQDSVSFGQI